MPKPKLKVRRSFKLTSVEDAITQADRVGQAPAPSHNGEDADIAMMESYLQESRDYRGKGVDNGLESEWLMGANQFLGNHWEQAGGGRVGMQEGFRQEIVSASSQQDDEMIKAVINRDQNAVISNVEAQTSRPIVTRLNPIESNEPARAYLTERAGRRLWALYQEGLKLIEQERDKGLALAGDEADVIAVIAENMNERIGQLNAGFIIPHLTPDQMTGDYGPTQPLSEEQLGRAKELIASGVLDRKDVFEANDRARVEYAQRMFDLRWRQARGNAVLKRSLLYSGVYGHQGIRAQWHPGGEYGHRFTLHNEHVLDVDIDPFAQHLGEARYLILEKSMSPADVKRLYPNITDEQLEHATRLAGEAGAAGNFQRGGGVGGSQRQSQRGMVLVRIGWFRHEEVPLPPRRALDEGLVTREPELDEESGEQARDPDSGALRWRYFLADEAETQVEPTEDCCEESRWPTGPGLKQVVSLPAVNNIKLQSIRCPYRDMPWGWTINIPRPDYSIYGQGETARLKHLSDAINREFSIMLNHDRFYQSPMIYMPTDLYDELERMGMDPYVRPGGIIPIDTQLWQTLVSSGGFDRMMANPPAMPAGTVQKLQLLLNLHDSSSGNQSSRQGRAPFSGASGELVQELNEQALGPVSYKASHLEEAVQDLAEVLMDAIVRFTPEGEWRKIATDIPLAALRDLVAGMEMADLNFTIEATAGRGANRELDEQRAMFLYEKQLQSRRTTQDALRVPDPDNENRLITEEQAVAAPMTASAGAPLA